MNRTTLDASADQADTTRTKAADETRLAGVRLAGVRMDARFGVVFLLGTVIRLIALFLARGTPFTSDAADYVEAGRKLLSGVHFVPYWPPGLPLYLAGWLAAGAGAVELRASMLFFWVLLCWGIWKAARELGFADKAWLLLLVVAVMPASIHLSIETLTQQPVAALLLVSIASALAWENGGGVGDVVALGAGLGWMVLVRPSALPLLVAIPLMCAWGGRRRARWRAYGAAVGIGLALAGAWMVRAHALSGAWMMNSSNGVNLYDGNNPWTPAYRTWFFGSHAKPGTEEARAFPEFEAVVERVGILPPLAASKEFQRLAVEEIRTHPGRFAVRTCNRVRCFFGFPTFTALNLRQAGPLGRRLFLPTMLVEALVYVGLMGFAVFAMAAAGGSFWRDWRTWTVLVAVVLYAAPYWLSMSHPTYNFPVVVPVALLGIMAARRMGEGGARWRGWVAVAVLLAVQLEWVVRSAKG